MTQTNRRSVLAGIGATAAAPALSKAPAPGRFPVGFHWGAATAAHQIEGNNVGSDLWVLENVKPTVFAVPSGDAVNSFALWGRDLELIQRIGLNSYRFSLEWARIEPEESRFSQAMLDHYKAVIHGCRDRGIAPIVTFNHFTTPRWFASTGGWTNPQSPALFARFCERAARELAAEMAYAVTLNQPNTPLLIRGAFPASMQAITAEMLRAAGRATGSQHFSTFMFFADEDYPAIAANVIAAHKSSRDAIKTAAPQLPVGMSLAMTDEQGIRADSIVSSIREERYGPWLRAAKGDDFLGVQNYARARWDVNGQIKAAPDGPRNFMGQEVYAPSLAGAVRYAHEASGLPILVTEHGVGTDDDKIRADLIPAALSGLLQVIGEGTPVLGYVHWSLVDNYEWLFGFRPHYGLASADRTTFARMLKPSARVLGSIARRNHL